MMSDKQECTTPPPGWHCARNANHSGPCAAVRSTGHLEMVAIIWTGKNLDDLREFVPEEFRHNKITEPMGIKTRDGVKTISVGDWIIRTKDGFDVRKTALAVVFSGPSVNQANVG